MSDAAFHEDLWRPDQDIAAELIRRIAGRHYGAVKRESLLENVYRDLAKLNREWTRRRVRALADREAARVEHREIREMERAAALREAREQHEQDLEESRRLALRAARLAASGAASDAAEVGRVGATVRVRAVGLVRAGAAE